MVLAQAKRALKYFNPTFVRNRAAYLLAEHPPLDDVYTDADIRGNIIDQRPLPTRWNVENLEGTVACPEVKGLFLHRGFIHSEDLQHVEQFVMQASFHHGWFTYHKGRDMMPVNSIQRTEDKDRSKDLRRLLLSLQSTNNTDPATWPCLKMWSGHHAKQTPSAASGAEVLSKVQRRIQAGELLPRAQNEPCLFVQIQNVIRGGVVGSHIDPVVKGGKVIATLIVNGVTDVRVGDTVLRVEPGDVYGIEGAARYNIEHEVYPTVDDRLTATFRFGHDDLHARETYGTQVCSSE
jgi:hypothetical protein